MISKKLLAVTTFVFLLAMLSTRAASAAESLDAETMKAALHTATPEDDGFIETVVLLVNQGKLSRSLVDSTFLWARNQPQRPFQYFKQGLLTRLAAVNQQLPTPDPPPTSTPTGLFPRAAAMVSWFLERLHLTSGGDA